MENVKIKFNKIIETIAEEFSVVYREAMTNPDYEYARKEIANIKNIFVDDEQNYIKRKDSLEDNLFIVVKFGVGNVNFGSSICPVSLIVLGTQNKIKPAQFLLNLFCSFWTIKTFGEGVDGFVNADDETSQIWSTPEATINFNEVENGFRSLFRLNGTLIISASAVKLTSMRYVIYPDLYPQEGSYEEVSFLSFNDQTQNNLEPQPFGNTFGYSKSESKFATNTFSISSYMLDTQLVADALSVKGFKSNGTGYASSKKPNDEFVFVFSFSNGFTNSELTSPDQQAVFFQRFKLAHCEISQTIGEITKITMAFSH